MRTKSMSVLFVGDAEFELLIVRRGEFYMGSENQHYCESPPHAVRILADFQLGKYPVTQSQWQAVMGFNPSEFSDSRDQPVDSISWDQANEFCTRMRALSGHHVRLPSEAEWEYACRGATQHDFFFGPWGPIPDEASVPTEARRALCDYAWYDLNSVEHSHSVGLKKPNPWGLYDMIGNVWEWCADVWHSDYHGAPRDGTAWVDAADLQPRRCLRGGAWDMDAFRCRSSYRSYDHKSLATSRFGFRIAVDC